jgi:hypothetical protein
MPSLSTSATPSFPSKSIQRENQFWYINVNGVVAIEFIGEAEK